MHRNKWVLFVSLLAVNCSHPQPVVFVDLGKILSRDNTSTSPIRIPSPPHPLPAKTYVLPEIPAQVLENTSSPEVLRTQADARRAQAQALKTIKERLTDIYLKQVDLFARDQIELLVDPEQSRINQLLPKLHAAFVDYAAKRLPIVTRLSFLANLPDTDFSSLPAPGKEAPEPTNLKPVQKLRWDEAVRLRSQLSDIDASYDHDAGLILADAKSLAAGDRKALQEKIRAYREEMLKRVSMEAANPLGTEKNLKVLRIDAAPEIVLPKEEPQTLQIVATDTLPNAPQVEFERLHENRELSRQLLQRQLRIWSSVNDYQVVTEPNRKVRDATQEFEQWRNQQEVGP